VCFCPEAGNFSAVEEITRVSAISTVLKQAPAVFKAHPVHTFTLLFFEYLL
jgi:hypothetical protein